MTTLLTTLHHALGDAVQAPIGPWRDVCRFPLGTPVAVVTPTTTEQVRAVLEIANATETPVVPVGERTAYWRPLHVEGAIALSTGALRGTTRVGDVVRVGAGEPVRLLDVALRQEGSHLPLHPDAYGETSLGSLVAIGCTSGIGMGRTNIDELVVGLTVVTGAGEVLHTGAAASLQGVPPFLRVGFPDATGLFMASEGTLGVVTEVVIKRLPTPWRVRLSGSTDDPRATAEVAHQLGLRGLYDTFRITREIEAGSGLTPSTAGWTVDAWVDSALDADDAQRRALWAGAKLAEVGVKTRLTLEPESARRGVSPAYDARWNGPLGAHKDFAERALFVGLDVNAPWDQLDALLAEADVLVAEQVARGAEMSRTALYVTGGFVNLGLHSAFPPDEATKAWAADHQQRGLERLGRHAVVPYRMGRIWPQAMRDRLDPAYRAWFDGLRAQLDPRGVLQPGHGLLR